MNNTCYYFLLFCLFFLSCNLQITDSHKCDEAANCEERKKILKNFKKLKI